eukprot:9489038-Pyramimonas_sp.AAC.2
MQGGIRTQEVSKGPGRLKGRVKGGPRNIVGQRNSVKHGGSFVCIRGNLGRSEEGLEEESGGSQFLVW